MKIVGFMA